MSVLKPKTITDDAFKSAKWDELTRGRSFSQSDIPALTLLCQWYAVVERCMGDLDFGGELPQVAYQNDMGDLKAMPQLSTMKQASAEIRALNKQLGINDEAKAERPDDKPSILRFAALDRANKAAKAAKNA